MSGADHEAAAPPSATIAFSRPQLFWGFVSIVVAAIAGYLWNAPTNFCPNDNARWDTVWSLVEFQTYQIYDTKEDAKKFGRPKQLITIDKVQKDGKTYASKPPILPTLIAGYVHVLKLVIGEPFTAGSLDPNARAPDPKAASINIYGKATLYLFNLAPFVVYLILYRRFLDRYTKSDLAWIYCLLAAGLGTYTTGYLSTLNNHTLAACFGFFTYYLMIRIVYDGKREIWRYFLAGLCGGWTVCNEMPAGLLVVSVAAILLYVDPKRTLLGFVPGLALVTAAFFAANYAAIGSFLPAYLQKDLYDYAGSYWTDPTQKSKIDALNDHPQSLAIYFLNMTFGHHGVFSLTPIYLLSFWGLRRYIQGDERRLPGMHWPILLASAGDFVFYWIVNDQRNYGGFCHGMRWLMWLGPLWLLFLPTTIEAIEKSVTPSRRKWLLELAWAFLLVSIFSMADAFVSPWSRSWLHRILWWFAVIDY